MRIAVVGCGIAGPASAIFLKQAEHDVVLLERAPRLGPVGAGILLQPPGLAVLERLGLRAEVEKAGATIRQLSGFAPSGRRILHLPYSGLPDSGFGLGIHRGRLFSLLHQRVVSLGIPIRVGQEIEEVRTVSDREAVLRLSGGGEEAYDLVVVADGAHARTLCGPWRPGASEPHSWGAWWMSLPDPEMEFRDTLHQVFAGSRRLLGVLPTGDSADGQSSTVSLFWGIRRDEAAAWQQRGLEACREEIGRLEPRLRPLLLNLRDVSQMTLAGYHDHRPKQWHSGRVVLVGDAAHAMSPHLGQGANLALQDAAALAEALRESKSVATALDAYQAKREPSVAMYQFFSRLMTPFFQSDWSMPSALRDQLMPLACSIPWMQRRMLRVLRGEVKSWRGLMRGTG